MHKGSNFSTSSLILVIFCLFVCFKTIVKILTSVKQYVTVLLICILLMTGDDNHLFMCLLAYKPIYGEVCGQVPCCFLLSFVFTWLNCRSVLYILDN